MSSRHVKLERLFELIRQRNLSETALHKSTGPIAVSSAEAQLFQIQAERSLVAD